MLRCEDCAFTAGTDANKSDITRLKARLCVEAPEPFHCHLREGLCAGWAEAANVKEGQGFFGERQPWQADVTRRCLDVIAHFESKDAAGEEFTEQDVINEIGKRVCP